MKKLSKIAGAILLITLLASCQSKTDIKQLLSNADTKKSIMDTIANDGNLSSEMLTSMMGNKNGKMAMMEHHQTMLKMNPDMMKSMMSDMMEACKSDTSLMSSMCKMMMDDHQMMDMMDKMKAEKKDMEKMKGMEHK